MLLTPIRSPHQGMYLAPIRASFCSLVWEVLKFQRSTGGTRGERFAKWNHLLEWEMLAFLCLCSTKEERFLISWATCDRVGVLCTQAKADPCFFVRSAGRSSFQRHFEWRHNFVAQRMLPRASQFVGRSRTWLFTLYLTTYHRHIHLSQ